MLDGTNPEVCITAQKLVLVSLLEVFKDLLPDYQIKHQNDQKVKRRFIYNFIFHLNVTKIFN